jgi:hypothetical protein
MRRGRGGGSAAVFTQPLSGAFAQGLDSAQYTDPSAGWRNDIDGVAQIANKLWLSACCACMSGAKRDECRCCCM